MTRGYTLLPPSGGIPILTPPPPQTLQKLTRCLTRAASRRTASLHDTQCYMALSRLPVLAGAGIIGLSGLAEAALCPAKEKEPCQYPIPPLRNRNVLRQHLRKRLLGLLSGSCACVKFCVQKGGEPRAVAHYGLGEAKALRGVLFVRDIGFL